MKTVMFIISCWVICLADNYNDSAPKPLTTHKCKWDKCPYQGIDNTARTWAKAVKDYTGCDKDDDGYWIDILHLQHPDEDYQQLEDRLLNDKVSSMMIQ